MREEIVAARKVLIYGLFEFSFPVAMTSFSLTDGESLVESRQVFHLLTVEDQILWHAKRRHWSKVDGLVSRSGKAKQVDFASLKDSESGLTLLMLTVKSNQVRLTEVLTKCCQNIDEYSKSGMTALHYAASCSHVDIVQLLLRRGANPLLSSLIDNSLPLHLSCQRSGGSMTVTNAFLVCMPHKSRLEKDKAGYLPICYAVKFGNVQLIRLLLQNLRPEQIAWKERRSGNSLLHIAALKHDMETIKCLLVDGQMDANVKNAEGKSCMHFAAETSDMIMLKLLHQVGKASANLQDRYDSTPCHVAAKIGQTSLMTYMIDRIDADSLMRTKDGSTLMHLSAFLGNDETVLALIERDAPLSMPNKDKKTPLHICAERGHINVALNLLKHGAPIEAKTKEGYTALHLAVIHNKPEIVELLIGFGATIDVKGGPRKETPLNLTVNRAEGYDCAKMLLLSGANVNATNCETGEAPLHIVSRFGYLKLVQLFLHEEANVLLTSVHEESALHIAVRHCHFEVVRALLKFAQEKGVAENLVNMANTEGETALHLACELIPRFGADIAYLLLEHGADLVATTKYTLELPFHYAARCDGVELMLELGRYMTEYHTIANRQAKNGWSALLTAAFYGHEDVSKLLLDREVRTDVLDEHGLGALHLAAAQGFMRCCELLLSRKVFVNAKSKLGITPLHLAAENGYADLVQTLVKHYGATIDAMTLAKQTALHKAAENGHLEVVKVLVKLRANVKARDSVIGLPIHLAAKNNHHAVVKFFLGAYPELAFLATTHEGLLCSHLAAASGSIAVIRELLRFNRNVAIATRSRETESLSIHMAALKGNSDVVALLINAGASAKEENKAGMAVVHAAAMNGHLGVLATLRSRRITCNVISKKNGLSPIHIAAFYGKAEAVRDLLTDVKVDLRSRHARMNLAHIGNNSLRKLLTIDHDLTALDFAAFAGQDAVVRLLLNTPGVDVEATSHNAGTTAMHLAAINGHLSICSLLLAKSPRLLTVSDKAGMTPLMFAAQNGHRDMVINFAAQGADVNTVDKLGWSSLLFAARFGKLDVVELLVELGASTNHASSNGKTPLSVAAAHGHVDVFYYLLKRKFDTDALLQNESFLFDLMICGRSNKQQAIEEFTLACKSPLSTAATLTKCFRQLAATNKQYSKELVSAGRFCEKMCSTLIEIAVSHSSASAILQAIDAKGRQVIDVMLDDGLKTVMAKPSVQRYLSDVWWDGNLGWSNLRLFCLFLVFLICPPVMAYFVLPLPHKFHRIPVIRFLGYISSHLMFIGVLFITVVTPLYPNHLRESFLPTWNEVLLLLWLGGNLTAELTNPSGYREMRILKKAVLAFSAIAMALQVVAIFINNVESYDANLIMYIRNIVLSIPVFLSVQMCLDFTALNHHFGPMIIIMKYMIEEVSMLFIMLMVFFVGFWLQLTAIYSPVCPDLEPELTVDCVCNVRVPAGCLYPETPSPGCRANYDYLSSLTTNFQLLISSLFNQGDYMNEPAVRNSAWIATATMRIQFGIFQFVMVLTILTLMLAVSADVYERMHRRSDLEWKFGRAKLIRGMIKTAPTPSPFNLFVKPFMYIKALLRFKTRMFKSMSEAAYNLSLIEDAAGVFDADEEIGCDPNRPSTMATPITPQTFLPPPSKLNRFSSIIARLFKQESLNKVTPESSLRHHHSEDGLKGVSYYKRGRQHVPLMEVVNWRLMIDRYREIRAEGADEEDAIIQELGISISEMEDWQLAMWLEMDEMEDEVERHETREWLIEEFNSIIKT